MLTLRLFGRIGRNCLCGTRGKHTLPELSFDYKALEPTISGDIMELHYSKHHATYVNNYNNAEEQLKVAVGDGDINQILSLQSALRFNGGGHLNHSIFWTNLNPKGGGVPTGSLMNALNRDFGSFDAFKNALTNMSIGVQGSGWGWLGYDVNAKKLKIVTCANQDPLEATTGLKPLLGIDVWEHAYYMQYKNVRADYVKAIWDVVHWKSIGDSFDAMT